MITSNFYWDKIHDYLLLVTRIIVVIIFYNPQILQIENANSLIDWFTKLNVPLLHQFKFIIVKSEIVIVLMLILGLFTNFVAIILLKLTAFGMFMVYLLEDKLKIDYTNFSNLFLYLALLFLLFNCGGGKFSMDFYIQKLKTKAV